MLPPPPGLFSTTAVSLRRACSPLAISRATTSLAPPGVNGTMMRIVLLGKPCAQTDETEADEIKAAAMRPATNRRILPPTLRAKAARRASTLFKRTTLPQILTRYEV